MTGAINTPSGDDPDTVARHDAGGKTRLAMIEGVDGKAEFSPCGRYRYWLSRDWSQRRFTDGRSQFALWIGMNPSVADAGVDDPTIRREMGFTKGMMIDTYVKCNVMDYRATDPKTLLSVPARSDRNLECINALAGHPRCAVIIVAWGALPKKLRRYADDVVTTLGGRQLHCMGVTANGSPRHPLYLPNTARCEPWPRIEGDRP